MSAAEREFYGYTGRDFRDSLIVMSMIGMAGGVLALLGRYFSNPRAGAPWAAMWLLVVVPGIWILVSIPLSATWLELRDSELHWTLWRRWQLRRFPVDSVRSIGTGSFAAVRIETTHGTIHLFGLHMKERTRLAARLRELNPAVVRRAL